MAVRDHCNIILVTIDSLRADYCGYIDEGTDATPTLTDMAQGGVGFERAIAPGPSTPESMPAIFTGRYPTREPSGTASLADRRAAIRRHLAARDSLPERLARRGYATAGFTPNPFTSRHFGFDQGFDHFQDFMGEARNSGTLYERVFKGFLDGDATSSLARVVLNFWQREEVFKPWESYYDEIVDWTATAEEPYFIWIFLMDAHNPYLPSSTFRSQSRWAQFHANYRFWRESHETPFAPEVHDRLVTAYTDAVRYADACLARLRDDLAADNPAFVVHGDHGESFGEHGTYGHEPYLYPENVHVPLVVEGMDSARLSTPISLRALPEIVSDVARGSLGQRRNSYAITKTSQGAASAVYTPNGHAIWQHGDGETVPGVVESQKDSVVRGLTQFLREQARIEHAVAEVAWV